MTEASQKKALIIEQLAALTDEIQETLRILAAEYGIDVYTTRQRMLGGGLAHFGNGPEEKVKEIAFLLENAGVKTWIIKPSKPRFGPQRLRSLQVTDDQILFTTQQQTYKVEKATRVIGILSDVSGAVVDKQLKRLMVQNVYKGTTENARLEDQEIRRTILLSQPVYDLYIIDEENQISTTIRALPGKFAPKGLGDKATLSARGNLGALIELTESFTENFTLHTGYGLSPLPGCQLKKEIDGSDWQMQNLKNAVRYGWLMADLALQPQTHRQSDNVQEGPSVGTVAAATLIGRPELATTGALKEMPGIGEVIDEIDKAVAEKKLSREEQEEKVDNSLPMPPEPKHRAFSWRVMGSFITTGVVSMGLVALFQGNRLPGLIIHYGYNTGLGLAVLAGGFFWGGFNFFMLKRHVENTPTSKVRSMAMGMVEIHGQARRKYALVAPMSQSPCVYYRLRKYRREDRGGEHGTWRLKSESDSGHVPFFIEDATGRVTVDPYRAAIRAGVKQEGSPGQGNILLGGSGGYDSNEKWIEDIIHEGTSLYILGDAKQQRQQRKSLREKKIEKLRDLKLDRAAMQKYDIDGDGQIDADEWQAAREDVEDQVLRERLAEEHQAARQEDYIVIGRSSHRSHPFVIAATKSEAHLTRNYALFSGLLLTGSLLVGCWALAKVLRYFGVI